MYFEGMARTKCPYYIRESKFSITCEGIEENTEHMTKFPTEGEKLNFQRSRCYYVDRPCSSAAVLNDLLCGSD